MSMKVTRNKNGDTLCVIVILKDDWIPPDARSWNLEVASVWKQPVIYSTRRKFGVSETKAPDPRKCLQHPSTWIHILPLLVPMNDRKSESRLMQNLLHQSIFSQVASPQRNLFFRLHCGNLMSILLSYISLNSLKIVLHFYVCTMVLQAGRYSVQDVLF